MEPHPNEPEAVAKARVLLKLYDINAKIEWSEYVYQRRLEDPESYPTHREVTLHLGKPKRKKVYGLTWRDSYPKVISYKTADSFLEGVKRLINREEEKRLEE